MYWTLVKHTTIFILTFVLPRVIRYTPARNHIGLINWLEVKTVGNLASLIRFYTDVATASQIIVMLIYYITQKIIIIQSKSLGKHDTFVTPTLILLVTWLNITIRNYRRIRDSQLQQMYNICEHMKQNYYKLEREADTWRRMASTQPIRQWADGRLEPNHDFVRRVLMWRQERIEYRQKVRELTREMNELKEEILQKVGELNQMVREIRQEFDTILY